MQTGFTNTVRLIVVFVIAVGAAQSARASDWPTWGGNEARSGVATSELPPTLSLNWVLKQREPDPAWHSNQERVQFDRMYEPVVARKRMFVGSMVSDRMTAYDTETGTELWRFYTDGPVRLAPAVANDKVYFACDDGHLYCLGAADGALVWKFNGAPLDRKVLGNDRLISIYSARGAPVVYDGSVYFAASVWPFMGVFIHALDAETGEVSWTNSATGSMYILQQHDRPAFAGIAPQGYLVASGDTLLVSGGQTLPAAFDRHTGRFLHYNLNTREMGEKGAAGYHVRAARDFFVTNEYMFRMSDGAYLARLDYPIITEKSLLNVDPDGTMHAYEHDMRIEKTKDRKGRETLKVSLNERWSAAVEPKLNRLHLAAGTRVFGTGEDGLVAAVEFSEQTGDPQVVWSTTVDGDPLSLIAADDKLFVSTDRGDIYCFAGGVPESGAPLIVDETAPVASAAPVNDEWTTKVAAILKETEATSGYCVLLGIGSGRLLDELVAQSDLHVIALDPDADKVAAQRRRLDALGLYGTRVAVLTGDIFSVSLPPYLAQLVVSHDLSSSGFERGVEFAARVYDCLRPYGGAACLPVSSDRYGEFAAAVRRADLPKAELRTAEEGTLAVLTRVGQLPGAADWTHQYADAGNSVASAESLAKAPLGLLWFGGPSNEKVLPRHGHGPTPQVAGGRLFIEGRDMLRAVDVYTGRLLWEHDFPNLGQYYDYTSHEPGANAIGSNYVSLPDSIYVIHEQTCYRLDAATGETISQFHAPPAAGEAGAPELGYLSVVGDVIIAGVQPLYYRSYAFDARQLRRYDADKGRELMAAIRNWRDFEVQDFTSPKPDPAVLVDNLNRLMFGTDMLARIPDEVRTQAAAAELEQQLQASIAGNSERETDDEAIHLKRQLLEKYYDLPIYEESPVGTYGNLSRRSSQRLVGLNRFTGDVLWEVAARHSFRHNAIAAGNGRVFALDRLEDAALDHQRRRGLTVNDQRRIAAWDLATGQEVWSSGDRIFGTWLGYSTEHDVLVQAGSLAGDRAPDEVGAGIVAYNAADGTVLWDSNAKYSGPLLLHHDWIYSQPGPGTAFHLLTGQPKMRIHPVSGDLVEWTYGRDGGCNTAICSEHLITFRSSAAGYFDLAGDSGTGNWGGFRSSCTSNLIPADGVLNAPDYTRTCTCAFQNRSSLALVHMPEVSTWTFNRFKWDGERVRHVGLNFGAPGDRRAPSGLLWLDFPSVGGDSPDIPVVIEGDAVEYVRHHPSSIGGHALNWVASSGVTGASTITVSLDDEDPAEQRPYTVRLYFSETEGVPAGERVFDVSVQDGPTITNLDVAAETDESDRVLVKEFQEIQAGRELKITLTSSVGRTVLCGVEIVAEGW